MSNLKKWGKYLVAMIVVLFVGSNLFLLLKEDSKAARTVNINDWTFVDQGDVKKLLYTTGVTKPETETHVYFDDQKGSLDKILVKEGDVVKNGTPLFSYNSQRLEEKKADLEDEQGRLQGEMDSIDQEISSLQQIETTGTPDATSTTSDDQKVKVDVDVDTSAIVNGNVQQKIAEAEAEKGKLNAALTTNEAKISRVEEQLADLTVKSAVDGQIVKINADLKAPIMTIASTASVVKAVVSAKQVGEIAEGQTVKLSSTLMKKTYKGTVSQVITYPNKEKKDKKADPTYSFLVKINDEAAKDGKQTEENPKSEATTDSSSKIQNQADQSNDGKTFGTSDLDNQTTNEQTQANQMPTVDDNKPLLIGTNMKLQVTVAEATNTPVIDSKSILKNGKKQYVYQFTNKGIVQKQAVTLGVAFKGKNQVLKGLQANDVIVVDQDAISLTAPSNFITPLKTTSIQNKEFKKMTQSQQAKYILMGLFED